VLKNSGIVINSRKEITDMGRWPDIYTANAGFGYYLHFYLDSEFIKADLADFCGKRIVSMETPIDRHLTMAEFCTKLSQCAQELTAKAKIPYDKIFIAGIAIPGLVDEKNSLVKRIPNFKNFNNENLFKEASQSLQMPVAVYNEARLCVVGEHITGFKNFTNIIYIDFTKNSGIGAGIMLNGELYMGKNGFAGEIGDMLVDTGSFYGGYREDEGCLEACAGLGVMFERLETLMRRGRAGVLKKNIAMENKQSFTLKDVENAVLMQDLDVMDVFDETMRMWAVTAANLAAFIDPDTIILGGVINAKNDVVLARINHYVSKVLNRDVDIRLSQSYEQALYNGGVHLLKKRVLNQMITDKIFQ
jgi:predicted NBD/HSP70 family sugar kinase